MNKINVILSWVMLLIVLTLTGSFIAMAMNVKTIVNIVKEEMSITEQHSSEFSLISNR